MSSTTEDYLKRIFTESRSTGKSVVTLGRLATLSGVTPGTITTMMKNLANAGMVDYLSRQGVKLTEHGRSTATRILRRHRLIELFLVEILGLDWSDVHHEAEILEHAVSDRIVDRIDEMLGYPIADPHGDPIPTAEGAINSEPTSPISEIDCPRTVIISRITKDEPEFLGFLKRMGLVPGKKIVVRERDELADTLRIEAEESEITLSLSAANYIEVEA